MLENYCKSRLQVLDEKRRTEMHDTEHDKVNLLIDYVWRVGYKHYSVKSGESI